MDCMEIRDKLFDYIDGNLNNNENEDIRLHINDCTECKKEYEGILEAIDYMQQGFNRISAPQGFMEDVKCSIKKPAKHSHKVKKPIKAALIAAVLTVLFTITAFAAGGFDFFKWWKEISIKESQSIEELITNGYGENVNISAQDKNIKFTIENVVADDTCTILSYNIEDLSREKKYMINDYMKGIQIEGEFVYPFEGMTDPHVADSILYSEQPYIQRGMIRLEPVMDEKTTINITINQLFYGDKKSFSSIDGTWKLSIPVAKYKSKIYTLNKEVDIDGHSVIFKEIKISPTNTALTYLYKEYQDGYNITNFNNIKFIANGREYKNKYMGADYSKSTNKGTEITIEFDSMYLDVPESIEISIGGYCVDVLQSAYYDIDVNKPFPQVFDYFGCKISIDDVRVGNEKTEATISQVFGKSKYERLNVDFNVKGHPFTHTISDGLGLESITLDKYGRKIDTKDMNEEKIKRMQPRTYYMKQQLIIEDSPAIEKLPEEYHTGKMIPTQLVVSSYKETRYVNESFTIKLDKQE